MIMKELSQGINKTLVILSLWTRSSVRRPDGQPDMDVNHICHFQGITIFNDAASGLIWVENQVSLGANKTVMGKAHFEQWLYDQCVCEIKHYRGDNGIFSAEEF
jgi:hypothetical protein